MAFKTVIQDPADALDYLYNWQEGDLPFLRPDEVIVSSTFSAYNDKWVALVDVLVLYDDTFTDTTATVWVKRDGDAVLAGKKYFVTNHITTDQGREKDLSILIAFKEQ